MSHLEPYQILCQELQRVRETGPVEVTGRGSGRFGIAIEGALGISQNSSKAPDFMGIELKTKSRGTLQTLFSRTPSRYLVDGGKAGFFERFSYEDIKRERRALYTSFSSRPDSLGFFLRAVDGKVEVCHGVEALAEYDLARLEEALLSKLNQTVFLRLETSKVEGIEYCEVVEAIYCKQPSILRFIKLVASGMVFLDFTLSMKRGSTLKDHGFLWRVKGDALEQVYLFTQPLNLEEVER